MPELDDGRRCRDFGAESDGARIPVVPADSKAHCVISITRAKLGNSTGQWQPGGHLAQRHHHGKNGETGEGGAEGDDNDELFQDAVRLVLEFGKASTSLIQRRLRVGYGRAAHLIDLMERDGIVGPADGPKPREILKRPDWLNEVEETLR